MKLVALRNGTRSRRLALVSRDRTGRSIFSAIEQTVQKYERT
jgi:hypothetical protein